MTQPVDPSLMRKVVPAYLAWTDDAGQPQQFRCFVKAEDFDWTADVSKHPTETGSDVTDNVRPAPREAKILFFESTSPLDDNNWASATSSMQVVSVPGPPARPPTGPITFEAWDNLILEKAIAAEAGGIAGGAIGGAVTPGGGVAGSAIGAIGGGLLASAYVGNGVPVPMVVPGPTPELPTAPQVITQQVVGFPQSGEDYVALTIALLEKLWSDVQIVDLIAPKLVMSSMCIAHIHVHRDQGTGAAAEIEVSLEELRFVSTVDVPAPAPSLPRASAPVNKGEQGTSDASPQRESLAHGALGAVVSGVKGLL